MKAFICISIFLAVLVVLFLGFLFFFPVVRICGYSMFPTFMDGQYFVSRRVFRKSRCKVGEVYVLRSPCKDKDQKFVIKRLADIKDGKYYFLGDNSYDSYDSRYYGYVNSNLVVAHIRNVPKEV